MLTLRVALRPPSTTGAASLAGNEDTYLDEWGMRRQRTELYWEIVRSSVSLPLWARGVATSLPPATTFRRMSRRRTSWPCMRRSKWDTLPPPRRWMNPPADADESPVPSINRKAVVPSPGSPPVCRTRAAPCTPTVPRTPRGRPPSPGSRRPSRCPRQWLPPGSSPLRPAPS